MQCLTRGLFRWGLIAGLALGGVTLLIGPQRVTAGFSQLRAKAQNMVDNCVDDPVALRQQLEELAGEYPDRIAEVRGELAEVEHQIGQFERDIQVADKVVAMTTEDLTELKTLVARAEETASSGARPVSIRFEGSRFDINEAYNEARRINNVRATYQDRRAHDEQQLKFLTEQKNRLVEIAGKLEADFSSFQAKMWQLDRQIDAIDRNERLIGLMEDQQETLASYEKFGKVGNLKQLEGKLAELRAVQEAQLQTMEKRGLHVDYEGKAELELDTDGLSMDDPFAGLEADEDSATTDGVRYDAGAKALSENAVAFLTPVIIE